MTSFFSESRRSSATSTNSDVPTDFYTLTAQLPRGKTIDFADLRGKVVLIVNTASKCGFTGQYSHLEVLHQKYASAGLVVLGFPCDQFGGQEPGSDDEIESFCQLNHGVTFPLATKSDVNGPNTNPVFSFLKHEKSGLMGQRIVWNFSKFLVDQNGKVRERFAPTTKPESMEATIEKLLAEV